MKFFAVFAAVLAFAAASSTGWTLQQLSDALQNPDTRPEHIPYLEHALNQMMLDIVAGKPIAPAVIVVPTAHTYTLAELSDALSNPATNPNLVPFLEHALNQMMEALYSGQEMESISVVIPVTLEPANVEVPILPVEVIPGPAEGPTAPGPAEGPSVPAPVVPEVPASSPLVQIIVNINNQQQTPDVAVAPPAVIPTPVIVAEEAADALPVDTIAISPPIVPGPSVVGPMA